MTSFNFKKKTPTCYQNILILFSLFIIISCKSTKQFYQKIKSIPENSFAVGHQDATSYGIGWNYEDNPNTIKSDINEIVKDFPAVYGFDIGHLELGDKKNIDNVSFNSMKKLIVDAYKKGGIITISWHPKNPVTEGDSWDKTSAIKKIISDGEFHEKYKSWLANIATFFNSLTHNNKPIPVVFRPYHEMNGSWFWWGGKNSNPTDYKTLWRETHTILKETFKVKNLLYAYSPNRLEKNDDYLKYYPGDEYVDILGIDIYDFDNSKNYIKSVKNDLAIVKKIALEKNKPYAFTETGNETLNTPNWFSNVLYPSIKNSGISWVLFWRNARKDHHYMPYKGHTSEDDFKLFYNLPETLFLKDISHTIKNK